ncbi:MAG: hypothetical protein ABIS69_12255 [Sediminibacterium sp.]
MIFLFVGCHAKKEAVPDVFLPSLNNKLAIEYDSLEKIKPQVLRFANLYVNDMNKKLYEDSMEYWSRVQQGLLDRIAETKYSIDSLQQLKH